MAEDRPADGEGPDPPLTWAAGDPVWDDWETPLNAPAVPMLHLEGFDGPMDLLLDLAVRQRTIAAEESDRMLKARAAVASTLMAGLELAREGVLTVRQGEAFGAVTMETALVEAAV